MSEPVRILVVDDEPSMRESLGAWLAEDGYAVVTAESGAEAVDQAGGTEFAVCFIDLKMPGMNGIDTMREIRRIRPGTAVVIITAYATVDNAVAAMKQGAEDYLVKPFNPEEASLLTRRILENREVRRENRFLKRQLSRRYELSDILSKSPAMLRVFDLVKRIASLPSTVLILGESGTGKELVAGAIHQTGNRRDRPFVHVSCAALAETLLESELFGHEKGAFTGATSRKIGKFEQADGGTLFLDEIGDIPPKLQLDLLRVLQERSFFRVGGAKEIGVDVRIIAATNRDLEEEVRQGGFREDLYYRLNVVSVSLPPLRERKEDIPLLARHFVRRHAGRMGMKATDISERALGLLIDRDWPGNVRELENAIERAMATCIHDRLDKECFDFLAGPAEPDRGGLPTDLSLAEVERQMIPGVLDRTGGNVAEAARVLGIDRSTLYEKMKKYGIERPPRAGGGR
ncbi:MAG: sigma-54 dependent transcriptional regulator [Planctomycetota bacterium]